MLNDQHTLIFSMLLLNTWQYRIVYACGIYRFIDARDFPREPFRVITILFPLRSLLPADVTRGFEGSAAHLRRSPSRPAPPVPVMNCPRWSMESCW